VFTPEEIGPIGVQTANGVVDVAVEDEAEAVAVAKRYLSYFQGRVANWTAPDQRLMRSLVPENRLRVYDIRGARVAPVWEGPEACPGEPVALAIAPGESAVLPIPPISAGEILGEDVPAAAYRVTVWLALAPDERVIEIEAGEVELSASS